MKVRTLIGNSAGSVIELDYADAKRCVEGGTHEWAECNGVALPNDWRSLQRKDLMELSRKITGGTGESREDAVTRIEAALASATPAQKNRSGSVSERSLLIA